MVGTNGHLGLLGIWPVSADASATTAVKEAQAAKEDSQGSGTSRKALVRWVKEQVLASQARTGMQRKRTAEEILGASPRL